VCLEDIGRPAQTSRGKETHKQQNMKEKKHMARTPKSNGYQLFAFTAPTALSVQLVGDFTNWQQKPINLKKSSKGILRVQVPLGHGTYHFKFLVDGQWYDDSECTFRVSNPFGTENMVREVKK